MKPWSSLLLKLSFAAGSIALLLQLAPVSKIVAVLGSVSVPWLVTGVALQFTARYSATFRMQVVSRNQGVELSRTRLYRILLASQFYSMFLPGLLGGAAAWIKYIQHGAGRASAAAMVVLNRGIRTGTTIALGFCAWLLDRPPQDPIVTAVLLVPVVAGFVLVLALPPRRAGQPLPRDPRNQTARRLRIARDRFLRVLSLSRGQKSVALLGTCLEVIVAAAASWCLANAVGVEIGFLSAVWVHAALTVVLLIPITVAGLGLREAGLVGLGAILGVAAPQAIAWSLTLFLGTLLVAAAGGLLETGWTSRRVGNLLVREGMERERRRDDS